MSALDTGQILSDLHYNTLPHIRHSEHQLLSIAPSESSASK